MNTKLPLTKVTVILPPTTLSLPLPTLSRVKVKTLPFLARVGGTLTGVGGMAMVTVSVPHLKKIAELEEAVLTGENLAEIS